MGDLNLPAVPWDGIERRRQFDTTTSFLVSIVFENKARTSYLRRPLGWGEALHASLDRGVDESLLRGVAWIEVDREETQHGFYTLECAN